MGTPLVIHLFAKLVQVVNLADRRNRKAPQVRLNQQRLRLIVGNTADAQVSFQFLHVLLKLRAERRILNIVNRPLESLLPVHRHAAAPRSQMGMVVYPVK